MTSLLPLPTVLATALTAALVGYAVPSVADEPEPRSAQNQAAPNQGAAEHSAAASLPGPNAVDQQVAADAAPPRPFLFDVVGSAPLQDERDKLHERTGLHIGSDYTSVYFAATDSLEGANSTAGSGVFRVYLKWDLLGRGTKNTGTLVVKGGNRHAYTELAPSELAPDLGYAGLLNLAQTDQGWRMTNLYWRQLFLDGEAISYLGFIDVTDYTDIYPLTSYYTTFSNLAFGTGSGTIGGLPDGALGAMLGGWLTDHVYAIAGFADANADQTSLFKGFSHATDDYPTFKSFDMGWAASREQQWSKNVHLTVYQIDESNSGPDGWGLHGSAVTTLGDDWMVFLRGGYGHDGGSPLEASVSTGFGYQGMPYGGVLGVGLNWGRPSDSTYGEDLDDEYTAEVFYRFQVTRNVQLTPSVQLLGKPALNPDTDLVAAFGIRARIAL